MWFEPGAFSAIYSTTMLAHLQQQSTQSVLIFFPLFYFVIWQVDWISCFFLSPCRCNHVLSAPKAYQPSGRQRCWASQEQGDGGRGGPSGHGLCCQHPAAGKTNSNFSQCVKENIKVWWNDLLFPPFDLKKQALPGKLLCLEKEMSCHQQNLVSHWLNLRCGNTKYRSVCLVSVQTHALLSCLWCLESVSLTVWTHPLWFMEILAVWQFFTDFSDVMIFIFTKLVKKLPQTHCCLTEKLLEPAIFL